MQYFLLFLEGIITFISPCLLPMIPIYISYFAGGKEKNTAKTLLNAISFVLGFTLVFVAMGALGGGLGGFFIKYRIAVNIITGLIVIIMGLGFMGAFELGIFRGMNMSVRSEKLDVFSSLIFGNHQCCKRRDSRYRRNTYGDGASRLCSWILVDRSLE